MIIALVTATIDGKIALSQEDQIIWHSKKDIELFVEDTKKSGAVVMGSTTYKQIRARGRNLPGRFKVVMTSSPDKYYHEFGKSNETIFTDMSPKELIEMLKERNYSDICIIGGGRIYTSFLNDKLIDEIRITIAPFIFGKDTIDFVGEMTQKPITLDLLSSTVIDEHFLRVCYKVKYESN